MSTTLVYPTKCSTRGPLTATDPTVLKAAAATASSSVYTDSTYGLVCLGWNSAKFTIDYKPGSETSILLKAQGWDGTTWRDLTYKATQGSGVSEMTRDSLSLTAANFSGTENLMSPTFDCRAMHAVRMVDKYTGSAPSAGTIGFGVILGMDIVD